jgi:hypothetical protein
MQETNCTHPKAKGTDIIVGAEAHGEYQGRTLVELVL